MIQQQLSPNKLPKQLFIKDPPYKALRGIVLSLDIIV